MSLYVNYQKEIEEIENHIAKIRNKSLKAFLKAHLHLFGLMYVEKNLPNKDLFHVDNIVYFLKKTDNITISKRTAYDIQHAIAAVSKSLDIHLGMFIEMHSAVKAEEGKTP